MLVGKEGLREEIAREKMAAVLEQQRAVVDRDEVDALGSRRESPQPMHDLKRTHHSATHDGRVAFDPHTEAVENLDGEGTRVLVTTPV